MAVMRAVLWPLSVVSKRTPTGSEKVSLEFWKEAGALAGAASQTIGGWEGGRGPVTPPSVSRPAFLAGSCA